MEDLLALLKENSEVQAVLSDLIVANLTELLPSALDGLATGLKESITTDLKAALPQPSEALTTQADSPDPLVQRIKQLEQSIANEQKARENAEVERKRVERDSDILAKYTEAFDKFSGGKVLHRDFIFKVLKDQLGELKDSDGNYLTANGKTLSEFVQEFFTSDVGKHFLEVTPTSKAQDVANVMTSSLPMERLSDTTSIVAQAFSGFLG